MASDADRAGAANGDRLAPAASASRLDRDGALRALHVLEEALSERVTEHAGRFGAAIHPRGVVP